DSSKIIAMIYGKGSYRARCIRRWAILCLKDNAIPPSFQGKYPSKSLLHDELVYMHMAAYLRSNKFKEIGQLRDNNDEARVIIALGANKDGYWNGAIGIWAFDNLTIHTVL
ncbi:26881_t:CDS:2, partial [Gigaspora margarita]